MFLIKAENIALDKVMSRSVKTKGTISFTMLQALLIMLLVSIFSAVYAQDSSNGVSVSLPNGYANIRVNDLLLQSKGGEVRWQRWWDGQNWKFNPHWESLSSVWSNPTCNVGEQEAKGHQWVWVDDVLPAASTAQGGGIIPSNLAGTIIPSLPPTSVAAANPVETTIIQPFNKKMSDATVDYPSLPAVTDIACPGGTGVNSPQGIRRQNELYTGTNGHFIFNTSAVLDTVAVKGLPPIDPDSLDAQLASGNMVIAPVAIPKGFRWSHKEGDWIEYNLRGQVVAYGDNNNNITWLARDTNGLLRGVVDSDGQVLMALYYTGELLTGVSDFPVAGNALDLPARSVAYQYDVNNRLTQITDVRGNTIRYDYDVLNRPVFITDQEGHSEQLAYINNSVSQRQTADGAMYDYSFSFDDVKQQFISKITRPVTVAGREVEYYTHDSIGKLVSLMTNGRSDDQVLYDTGLRTETHTNARGFITVYTRNEFEQITRIDNPDGTNKQRNYSAQNLQLTEEIDEAGFHTHYDYDLKGNLIKKTEAVGTTEERVTEYSVNNIGQTTQIIRKGRTESNGSITSDAIWLLDYDTQGQISQTTDPEGGIRKYVFDRTGNLQSVTDALGHTTQYQSDASGNLTKSTDAMGRIKSFTYDKVGNLISFTDARGKQTLANYDTMNRLLQTTNPLGGIATRKYNNEGLPTTKIDEDGRGIQLSFDNFQRLTQLTDGEGNQTQLAYNIPDGTPTGTLGSLSMPTEIKFPTFTQNNRLDALERPSSKVLLNANRAGTQNLASGSTYDVRGLLKSDTDANGKSRFYSYDALGQLTGHTDALGNKTSSLYDARGNLIQLTDANGNSHKFVYDRNDRVIKELLPLGQATEYIYDAAGNLKEKLDANTNKTTYIYDATNWLEEIKQYQGGTQWVRTTTLTWDEAYNLVAWSDTDASRPDGQQTASGTATFDEANRKVSETVNYPNPSGLPFSLSYSYQYSLAGKKTRLTWADGTVIDYGYSAHGELANVSILGEGILSVNQFKWTAPATVTLPGGSVQEKSFDGLLNLEGFKVKTPAQALQLNLANNFGKNQELISRSRTESGNPIMGTFSYDDELRLTQAVTDTGSLFGTDTETFTLDAVGNRIANSKTLGDWQYDANNRLLDKSVLLNPTHYDYDAAGNLIRKDEPGKITLFSYDTKNRLNEVRDGSGNLLARYGYDPFDRRIWKEQYRDRNGSVLAQALRSYYLYADEGLIAEATQNITLNADQTVSTSVEPVLTTQYGPRPDGLFGTGVLFVKTKNTNGDDSFAYYHHDQLGTPIQATDKTGNVVWSADYNVFGRATVTTPAASFDKPTITSRLRLPGQIVDEETGLHYNWHRYYEPEVGRYVTGDPIGLAGGDENLYGYVMNDPMNGVDPSGLDSYRTNAGHGYLVIDNPKRSDGGVYIFSFGPKNSNSNFSNLSIYLQAGFGQPLQAEAAVDFFPKGADLPFLGVEVPFSRIKQNASQDQTTLDRANRFTAQTELDGNFYNLLNFGKNGFNCIGAAREVQSGNTP